MKWRSSAVEACLTRLGIRTIKVKVGSGDLALVLADLDDFKLVNDTLGHAAGDAVLQEVAVRLCECVRARPTRRMTNSNDPTQRFSA